MPTHRTSIPTAKNWISAELSFRTEKHQTKRIFSRTFATFYNYYFFFIIKNSSIFLTKKCLWMNDHKCLASRWSKLVKAGVKKQEDSLKTFKCFLKFSIFNVWLSSEYDSESFMCREKQTQTKTTFFWFSLAIL